MVYASRRYCVDWVDAETAQDGQLNYGMVGRCLCLSGDPMKGVGYGSQKTDSLAHRPFDPATHWFCPLSDIGGAESNSPGRTRGEQSTRRQTSHAGRGQTTRVGIQQVAPSR